MEIHPPWYPDRMADSAEREVVRALQRAFGGEPDTYLIAGYILEDTALECDLVFLWHRGVFSIEVKGWDKDRWLQLARREADESYIGNEKNPVHQAWRRVGHIKSAVKRHVGHEVWVEERGALPWLSVAKVSESVLRRIRWLDRDRRLVIDADDLQEDARLRACLDGQEVPAELLPRVQEAIRGVVRERECVDCLATPGAASRLSPEQQDLVDWPRLRWGAGRWLLNVRGCAGSGKTLIALHRAWNAARQGRSVLLSCCNTSLAAKLRELVDVHTAPFPGTVDVWLAPVAVLRCHLASEASATFDIDEVFRRIGALLSEGNAYALYAEDARDGGDTVTPGVVAREVLDIWAQGLTRKEEYERWSSRDGRYHHAKTDAFYDICWTAAAELAGALGEAKVLSRCAELCDETPTKLYDQVIVDEAQDAYPVWLSGLAHSVKPGGQMVTLYDRAQSVQRLAMPIRGWAKPLGLFEHIDERVLGTNYRFPLDIFDWCASMMERDEVFRLEVVECGGWGTPERCEPIEQSAVQIEHVAHQKHAVGRAGSLARQSRDLGQTCAIYYIGVGECYGGRVQQLEDGWSDLAADRAVEIAPIGGLWGLEFDRVVLCGLNDDFPPSEIDPESYSQIRRMFLVAVTRARFHVNLIHWTSRPSPLAEELDTKRERT